MDDFFAYRTAKVVKIKDFRLGLLHGLFVVTSIFIVCYQFLYLDQGYNRFDTATGSTTLYLAPPDQFDPTTLPDACAASCNQGLSSRGCNCSFWDVYDLVYPEQQEYSMFVASYATLGVDQRVVGSCDPSTDVNPQCQQPWNSGNVSEHLLLYVDQFELDIRGELVSPIFLQEEIQANGGEVPDNSKWAHQTTNMWGQLVKNDGTVLRDFGQGSTDRIPLKQLFEAANLNWTTETALTGAILRLFVVVGDCRTLGVATDESKKGDYCSESVKLNGVMNYYQYQAVYIPGSSYFVARTIYSIDQNVRTTRIMNGIRIVTSVTGQQGKFSFPALLQTIVTLYIFLSLSEFIVDLIVLFLLPGRRLYSEAKYEVTENFTQLRKLVVNEQSIKKKVETLTKMARYQTFHEVEDLLNTIKDSVTEREYDQLVVACIEVYGVELRDVNTANNLVGRLKFDDVKIRAHILIGQLKEAYLLAVNIGSELDVRTILEEAQNTSNSRVVQLCTQYLAKLNDQ